MKKRTSRRFTPSIWTERVAPVLLVLLVLILLVTLVVIGLSLFGLTPE